ncbi:MAG: hypothetical protein JST19_12935 [Bacteroidetes bacterium]|nr:hypothetical protein [Bacteroidota bacterium]
MNKFLLVFIVAGFYGLNLFAQSQRVLGPVEKKIVDTLCNGINRIDLSKINTQEEAVAAYTQVVTDHADMLSDLAAERHVDMADMDAMKRVGMDLALDLFKVKCEKFTELSKKMAMQVAQKEIAGEANGDAMIGTFKRIDKKGFNYIVVADAHNNEKPFLWLRQFPGSESFMNGAAQLVGKKISISWKEIEVYLPDAKGYYPVKEITGITIQ